MITVDDYFAGYPNDPGITDDFRTSAGAMLTFVNALLSHFESAGYLLAINPQTGTQVSGERDGGWRPRSCPTGAPNSAHKQARAVDVYDPEGHLDSWLTNDLLVVYGLYREDPGSTRGWCHLTDRQPPSGRRTFFP